MTQTSPPRRPLRCAIYTRVSTEHGLEQEFNSLEAQREAAEAYVKSQAHEGWRALPARYDDGGFSGGSMARPALQQLLSDIRTRLIDIVVVYKVDRLTRALSDFAKLVDLFDAHQVSFVSVTQAFNTTTSMGRLTLNVLLSFAQFEREVTGERIRDKIAASKRKGLWMGGVVPLGYRVVTRKLVVDETEAEQVRMIFQRYLDLRSTTALQADLRASGIITRRRTLSSGKIIGGISLTNGPLGYLLRNRMYLGEINHKGQCHEGEHEAIVPRELFDAVQAHLSKNRNGRAVRWAASEALLMRRIYDDRGNRMTPAHANKNRVRYRYYVSCVLTQGRREEAGSEPRVPAPELETAVLSALRAVAIDADAAQLGDRQLISHMVERVVVSSDRIEIRLTPNEAGSLMPIVAPWRRPRHRIKRAVLAEEEYCIGSAPIRWEIRGKLLHAIARARRWLDELLSGDVVSLEALAVRESLSNRSVRMTLSLALLAPDVVRSIAEGTMRRGIGLTVLSDLPAIWTEQRRLLRFKDAT